MPFPFQECVVGPKNGFDAPQATRGGSPRDALASWSRRTGGTSGASGLVPGTLGAKLAHGDEDVVDLRDGFVSRHAVRRIIAGELDRALTRMRIGAILCPTVLFAFVNGTCLQQQVDSPSAQRPDRGASFLGHRHREHSCRTDPSALPLVPSG